MSFVEAILFPYILLSLEVRVQVDRYGTGINYIYFRKKNVEVLFCYESYDELVLMQLMEFDKKKVTSVENEMRQV